MLINVASKSFLSNLNRNPSVKSDLTTDIYTSMSRQQHLPSTSSMPCFIKENAKKQRSLLPLMLRSEKNTADILHTLSAQAKGKLWIDM